MLFLAARASSATRIHVGGVSSGELFELRKKIVQEVFESSDGRVLLPLFVLKNRSFAPIQKRVDAKADQASKLQPFGLLLLLIFLYFCGIGTLYGQQNKMIGENDGVRREMRRQTEKLLEVDAGGVERSRMVAIFAAKCLE